MATAAASFSPVARLADRVSPPRTDVYGRPDVYDMEYAGADNQDAHFFARLLARIRPRRVLELACGSGRVTLTLAAVLPAAEIVGVDSSIDMLDRAAAALDAAAPSVRARVTLVEGDMRDWSGTGAPFDAILIPCCSVSHLLTLDDRRRTWANAFRLLRPGGLFLLDVRMPDLATLAEAQRVRPRAFIDLDIDATRRALGDEARLLRGSATRYEPHLQRANVRLLYDRFDQRVLTERLVTDFASHVYFPSELELLFLSSGFEIARQFGDYRAVAVERSSPYVVTVARRPRRARSAARESGRSGAGGSETSAPAKAGAQPSVGMWKPGRTASTFGQRDVTALVRV